MNYPKVLSEDATLDAVLAGRSLARIGDGELKLAMGRTIKAQAWNAELGGLLREIALAGREECLVGIPNIAPGLPPAKSAYASFCANPAFVGLYGPGPYGSAFVSRPDCAPHIDQPGYWAKLRSLWIGRDVVLVRGSGKGLTPWDLTAAASFSEVRATPEQAWDLFQDLFERLKAERRTVLLCLGAVATALAWRLSAEGVHAVDLGGVGRFMRASPHAALS